MWTIPVLEGGTDILGGAAKSVGGEDSGPKLQLSLDVNALNFCRFSLLRLEPLDGQETALVALPNLVDSSLVRH